MARPRAHSGADGPKEPHSVSLKVLRLSRPSLSYQYPLPREDMRISPQASLAYPTNDFDPHFILSPNVTLPPAFGSAYVGETFACSLCANNEISDAMRASKKVSSVRILAEMQTPSQVFPLDLRPAASAADEGQGHRLLQSDEVEHPLSPSLSSPPPLSRTAGDELDYGQSLQKIVQFDLKEEGNHILAVSVSYTETVLATTTTTTGQSENDHQYTAMSTQPASSGRVRTFRKLYQFIAQPCLSVRTKASELAPAEIENKSLGPYGKTRLLRFALEAQLENVGDGTVVIEKAILNPKPPFKATDLNSDVSTDPASETELERPTMNPRDILQVAFLVEQEIGQQEGLENLSKDLKRDGRATLGQLSIEWRSAMGDRGFLTTGNLLTKKR